MPSISLRNKKTYYPFGMLQPGMYAENNDRRSRFGFNGMLRDDDVKGKLFTPEDEGRGNSYSTHYRLYDPRVTRWFSIDPLVAQFPWTSPYTGMGNNPVSRIDPMGDVDVNANASIKWSFGKQSHYSINASVGISEKFGQFMPGLNVGANIYNGGLGTTQGATGQNQSQADLVSSLSFTSGKGSADAMPLNTFNSMTVSSVSNTYEHSGTFAMNWVYNSEGRNQRVGGINARLGSDASVTIYNDIAGLQKQDQWWTGGGFADANIGNGLSAKFGTEVFTGRPDFNSEPIKPSTGIYGTYPMRSNYDLQLNNGQTFINVSNNNYNVGLNFSGSKHGYFQNLIHNYLKPNPVFDLRNAINSTNFTLGKSE